MRRSLTPAVVVLTLAMLAATGCSSGSDVAGESPAGSPAPAGTTGSPSVDGPLAGVSLAVDRAEQLDRIALTGLDVASIDDVAGLVATYEFADGDWWVPAC